MKVSLRKVAFLLEDFPKKVNHLQVWKVEQEIWKGEKNETNIIKERT